MGIRVTNFIKGVPNFVVLQITLFLTNIKLLSIPHAFGVLNFYSREQAQKEKDPIVKVLFLYWNLRFRDNSSIEINRVWNTRVTSQFLLLFLMLSRVELVVRG